MTQYILPIVGSYYRPPAKGILQLLRHGASLSLRREPDNPADPNAVAVWVAPGEIPPEELQGLATYCTQCGVDYEELMQREFIQLGYLPAKDMSWLWQRFNEETPAKLGFMPTGAPAALFDLEE